MSREDTPCVPGSLDLVRRKHVMTRQVIEGADALDTRNDGSDDGTVWLADAIELVRRELDAAQQKGQGSAWRFTVERVSLEFAVQFHRGGDGHAGPRLGVVEARLGGSVSQDSTHRIEVELKPHGESGRRPVSRGDQAPGGDEAAARTPMQRGG